MPYDMNLHAIFRMQDEAAGLNEARSDVVKQNLGIISNWLRNIEDVYRFHKDELEGIQDYEKRIDRLVELNVEEQVLNLAKTAIIQKAWKDHGHQPVLHGWVYGLHDGILKPLNQIDSVESLDPVYRYENL